MMLHVIKDYSKQCTLILTLFVLLFFLTSAKKTSLELACIHILDRNGFTETISNKERLKQYQDVDFLSPQPYEKVLRVYNRTKKGDVYSLITSYYENGNPKQYLQVINGRSSGPYYEWHSNGTTSLAAKVIGGNADITKTAEKTWVFDEICYVWNESGDLIAEIPYEKGVLQGVSSYFHPSGQLWKLIPYENNKVNGEMKIYLESGDLIQQTCYFQGVKDGLSQRFWASKQLASEEEFRQGKLEKGKYYDSCGNLVSEVCQGFGYRALFGKDRISELQEIKRGVLEGEVKVFGKDQQLMRLYRIKNGLKHGEEIEYFEGFLTQNQQLQPKISIHWYEGKIQGLVKSWYSNGNVESQREISNNAKMGLLTAWYEDGSLMMMEQYDKDKLVKGEYFKKGDRASISHVNDGKGMATLHSPEGHFVQKIIYSNGKPEEN